MTNHWRPKWRSPQQYPTAPFRIVAAVDCGPLPTAHKAVLRIYVMNAQADGYIPPEVDPGVGAIASLNPAEVRLIYADLVDRGYITDGYLDLDRIAAEDRSLDPEWRTRHGITVGRRGWLTVLKPRKLYPEPDDNPNL